MTHDAETETAAAVIEDLLASTVACLCISPPSITP